MSNTFSINGRVINMPSGSNVSFENGNIVVGSSSFNLSEFGDEKVVNIVVHGEVGSIDGGFASVTVNGNVDSVQTVSGSVDIEGEVRGSVKTVSGAVRAAGSIHGNVKTVSGSIRSS